MNLKYQHLFFDLDRTLWDYDKSAAMALSFLYDKYKLSQYFESQSLFINIFSKYNDFLWIEYREGRVHKDNLRVMRFELCFKEVQAHCPDLYEPLNAEFLHICPRSGFLIPGAIELLDYLIAKHYNIYIITNGFTQIQDIKIRHSGLDKYFKKVFTSESASSKKPQREMFEHCIKSVNAKKSQSLMIGDDWDVDIVGAANFGIDQVYFNPEQLPVPSPVTYQIRDLLELMRIL